MGFLDKLVGTVRPKEGTPVKSQVEVRAAVLALNRTTAPWHVREAQADEACDLVVEWKIVDAQWYEVFGKAKLESIFKVLLKLDAEHNEVRALDKEWTVSWNAGIPTLAEVSAFRGQKTETSFGLAYGFTETGALGEIYKYRFSTGEMKSPVKEAITAAGWSYKAVVFGKL